ncbi:putative secreted protein containing a PDZ domain [Actinoalloteichus hymeniacidonis]|uniref:endopeptidase La n=1 Tax=Actinoalloteichus hymeniacidonis TaxID=340345 RepID=A0AAC9MWZ1_9PSEU|nr:putative secreted protein containing a PDZ domain [Actinoalloteichus hymeniacidonis]
MVSALLVAAFGLLGAFVRVPYVALGPGPTYDTLGDVSVDPDAEPEEVISIGEGPETFETGGELRMTTVSVTTELSLFGALGLWGSGRYALAPEEEFYPPDRTPEEVETENREAFETSQSSAESAALRYLGYPTRVSVGQVVAEGPSDGILEPGDEILRVHESETIDDQQVQDALTDTAPGDEVSVVISRDGDERTETIALGSNEDRERGFLGIVPVTEPEADFDIDIELSEVGGPSAGLIFALAIVDKLTEGSLTDDTIIAGTGEISSDGRVGPIGGIQFKMTAAKEEGASIFLVPADNCIEAVPNAPDGLRLVRVETLESAIDSLESLAEGGEAPSCS